MLTSHAFTRDENIFKYPSLSESHHANQLVCHHKVTLIISADLQKTRKTVGILLGWYFRNAPTARYTVCDVVLKKLLAPIWFDNQVRVSSNGSNFSLKVDYWARYNTIKLPVIPTVSQLWVCTIDSVVETKYSLSTPELIQVNNSTNK